MDDGGFRKPGVTSRNRHASFQRLLRSPRILNGADPATEKQAGHPENENTVQALYERYRSRKQKVLRSWTEVRRIMEREVIAAWRHRRVVDIRLDPRDDSKAESRREPHRSPRR